MPPSPGSPGRNRAVLVREAYMPSPLCNTDHIQNKHPRVLQDLLNYTPGKSSVFKSNRQILGLDFVDTTFTYFSCLMDLIRSTRLSSASVSESKGSFSGTTRRSVGGFSRIYIPNKCQLLLISKWHQRSPSKVPSFLHKLQGKTIW